jgi:hypothetical protein
VELEQVSPKGFIAKSVVAEDLPALTERIGRLFIDDSIEGRQRGQGGKSSSKEDQKTR